MINYWMDQHYKEVITADLEKIVRAAFIGGASDTQIQNEIRKYITNGGYASRFKVYCQVDEHTNEVTIVVT